MIEFWLESCLSKILSTLHCLAVTNTNAKGKMRKTIKYLYKRKFKHQNGVCQTTFNIQVRSKLELSYLSSRKEVYLNHVHPTPYLKKGSDGTCSYWKSLLLC